METKTNERVESREQYAERYLRSKLFEIVQHYDKTAVANPPEVQAVMFDIIDILVTTKDAKRDEAVEAARREAALAVVDELVTWSEEQHTKNLARSAEYLSKNMKALAYDAHSRAIEQGHMIGHLHDLRASLPTDQVTETCICSHTGLADWVVGFGWKCRNCGGLSGNHGGTPGTGGDKVTEK